VTVNVSAPIGAATGTLQVNGVGPEAALQLGDVGVRFATVGLPPPLITIASDCVDGETYCGRIPCGRSMLPSTLADDFDEVGMRIRNVAVALLVVPDPGGELGIGWKPPPPPDPAPLQLANESALMNAKTRKRVAFIRQILRRESCAE
jgi:hypothetical protein